MKYLTITIYKTPSCTSILLIDFWGLFCGFLFGIVIVAETKKKIEFVNPKSKIIVFSQFQWLDSKRNIYENKYKNTHELRIYIHHRWLHIKISNNYLYVFCRLVEAQNNKNVRCLLSEFCSTIRFVTLIYVIVHVNIFK